MWWMRARGFRPWAFTAASDARGLAGGLADRGVHVSVRGDAVRLSAHAYNTVDAIDRFLAALAEVLGRTP